MPTAVFRGCNGNIAFLHDIGDLLSSVEVSISRQAGWDRPFFSHCHVVSAYRHELGDGKCHFTYREAHLLVVKVDSKFEVTLSSKFIL